MKLVIIPTYNEAENINALIKQVLSQSEDLHILIVDDNSPDGTAGLVKQLISARVHLKQRQGKLGLGSAYRDGFAWALANNYNYVISMDADFSHNPADILRLLEHCSKHDIVLASRKIEGGKIIGWNWQRKLSSNGAMWLSRLILRLKTKDVTAGFKCYNKRFLEFLSNQKIKSNGYAFQIETIFWLSRINFPLKKYQLLLLTVLKASQN